MYKNILVPIAFDHERDTKHALEIAQALRAEGGKITALNVVEHLPSYATEYLTDEMQENSRQGLKKMLADKVAGFDGVDLQIVEGHAGRTILEQAELNEVDMIVVASHCPTIQDYLLGSTAARVVRHARCAVHVVR